MKSFPITEASMPRKHLTFTEHHLTNVLPGILLVTVITLPWVASKCYDREPERTPNSQRNLEKEEQKWRHHATRYQIILHGYSSQNNTVLA